jgi:hypothetical protein
MSDFTTTWDSIMETAAALTKEERTELTEEKYKVGDLVWLEPEDLQYTEWNPYQRTESIDKLVGSIARTGQILVPLVIDTRGNLIEGNRRLAAVKHLRHLTAFKSLKLPCFVVDNKSFSNARMFDEISGESRKSIGTGVALSIFLKNKDALAKRLCDRSMDIVSLLGGAENAEKFSNAGGSLTYYRAIETLKRFTGVDGFTIGMWLLRNGLRHKVKWLVNNFDQKKLSDLIRNNKYPRR